MLKWRPFSKALHSFAESFSVAASRLFFRTRRAPLGRRKPSKPFTRYDALNMLRFQNNPDKALQIVLSASGKHLRATYDTLIDKLFEANRVDLIELFVETFKKKNSSGVCFVIAIGLYGRARMADNALRTFYEMPYFNYTQTLTAFNTVLNALVKSEEYELLHQFYQSKSNLGIVPDIYTYNILIRAELDRRRVGAAFELVSRSLKEGLCPDPVTFSTFMIHFLKRKEFSKVYYLLSIMSKSRCSPDAATCDILVTSFCKEGKVNEALTLLNDMLSKGYLINVHTYNVLLKCLCERNMIRRAGILFGEMTKTGCRPNVVSYCAFISGLCKDRQVDLAWKLLGFVVRRNWVPNDDTCKTMTKLMCKSGRFEESVGLLDKMHKWGFVPDVETWNALVDSWSNSRTR